MVTGVHFDAQVVQGELEVIETIAVQRQWEERLCVACMEHERKVVLLPCRHMCMCKPCTDKVLEDTGQCPVCREHVVDSLEAFF